MIDHGMSLINDTLHITIPDALELNKVIYNGVEFVSGTQWIPCSERLPEYYGNYLVSVYDDEEPDIGTIHPEDGRWSLCDAGGFYWADSKGLKVKAWMPLPEPWGGDSDE